MAKKGSGSVSNSIQTLSNGKTAHDACLELPPAEDTVKITFQGDTVYNISQSLVLVFLFFSFLFLFSFLFFLALSLFVWLLTIDNDPFRSYLPESCLGRNRNVAKSRISVVRG